MSQTRRVCIPLKKFLGAHLALNGWGFFLLAMVLCFPSPACLPHRPIQEIHDPSRATKVANLISVPMTYQAYDYACGVAALQSILYYYGESFRHEELAEVLAPDPKTGTNYRKVAEFARSHGFQVDIHTHLPLEDLKKLIDARKPVMVLLQAWPESPVNWSESWDEGHYAVAIGYDENNIYFMDPSTIGHYTFIPILEFMDRWHDLDGGEKLIHFGMVITKQGPAPYDPDIINRQQ
jgi:predicted double-glycine peptidase